VIDTVLSTPVVPLLSVCAMGDAQLVWPCAVVSTGQSEGIGPTEPFVALRLPAGMVELFDS
jgi:hypothetical protein